MGEFYTSLGGRNPVEDKMGERLDWKRKAKPFDRGTKYDLRGLESIRSTTASGSEEIKSVDLSAGVTPMESNREERKLSGGLIRKRPASLEAPQSLSA